MRFFTAIFVLFVVGSGAQGARADGGMHALIIGIGTYENIRPLRNPKHDATLAEAVFQNLGFETKSVLDVDTSTLRSELEMFQDRLY